MLRGPEQGVLLVHSRDDGWSAEATLFHVHWWLVLVAQSSVSVQLFLGDRLGALFNLIERELDMFDFDARVVREFGDFVALLQHIDNVLEAEVCQSRCDRRLKLGAISIQLKQSPDILLEVVQYWLWLGLSLSSDHALNN